MNRDIMIIKRDGSREPLDIEKIHFVVENACNGLAGVSSSQVEMNANIQFYNGMSTGEIQEVDLPTEEDEDLDILDILDNDDDPNHLDASEIITYIESYGGILNQEMKKKEVMRDDISDKDRKEVYLLLEKCGVKTYKANKFRTFFYFGTEEEGKEKYEAYMSSK